MSLSSTGRWHRVSKQEKMNKWPRAQRRFFWRMTSEANKNAVRFYKNQLEETATRSSTLRSNNEPCEIKYCSLIPASRPRALFNVGSGVVVAAELASNQKGTSQRAIYSKYDLKTARLWPLTLSPYYDETDAPLPKAVDMSKAAQRSFFFGPQGAGR